MKFDDLKVRHVIDHANLLAHVLRSPCLMQILCLVFDAVPMQSISDNVVNKPNEFVINFKTYPRPYHYKCATVREKQFLVEIFRRVLENRLNYVADDTEVISFTICLITAFGLLQIIGSCYFQLAFCSLYKGHISIKGTTGLFSKKYGLLGNSNILLFKNERCTDLVACLGLVAGKHARV